MKVLHVEAGAHLYGGALQVLYLLEGLAERGIESHLTCRPGTPLGSQAASFAQVQALPMGGDLDLALVARLYRLMRRLRPDLVHLHSRIGADVMGGVAARLARVPVVLTRRVDNPEAASWVQVKYRLYDRVIAISDGIGRVLLAEGLPAAKLRLVRSAVIAARYQRPCGPGAVSARLGLDPDAGPLIGVVAQLIPRKGHRLFLRALPQLLTAFPRLQVLFFGQGPLAKQLAREIKDAGLDAHVQLAGFRADLPEIIGCLDLLVHPAWMEGLGVSLLQAAAARVPIVATRVGGIPEAVEDGVTGLLVAPGDLSGMTRAILRLLQDPSLRQRFGAAGADRVSRLFSRDTMVEGNLQVYRELLAAR